MVVVLEDEDRGALALDHAVAVERERAAAVAGHDAQALPRLDAAEAQHRLAAAGEDHVGEAGADQHHRLAHRVVRRGAGGGDGVARALEVPRHRDVGGGGAVHQPRHDEGVNAVLPLLVDEAVVLVLGLQAAARGAEDDAGALGERLADVEAGLRHRLAGGEEGELAEGVVEGQLLPGEVLLGAVAADLAADRDRRGGRRPGSRGRRCPSGPRASRRGSRRRSGRGR